MYYVYLLHFEQPYKHARHYVGFTNNPQRRLIEHLSGQGNKLVKLAADQSGVLLARLWAFTDAHEARMYEKQVKDTHHAPSYCPLCRKEK